MIIFLGNIIGNVVLYGVVEKGTLNGIIHHSIFLPLFYILLALMFYKQDLNCNSIKEQSLVLNTFGNE
jgi:hypothetical protein